MGFEFGSPGESVLMEMLRISFINRSRMLLMEDHLSAEWSLARGNRLTVQEVLGLFQSVSFPAGSLRGERANAELLVLEVRLYFSLREDRYFRNFDLFNFERKTELIDLAFLRLVNFPRVAEFHRAGLKNTAGFVARALKELRTGGLEPGPSSLLSKENVNVLLTLALLCRGDEKIDGRSLEFLREEFRDYREFLKMASAIASNETDGVLEILRRFYDKFIRDFKIITARSEPRKRSAMAVEALAMPLRRARRLAELDKTDCAKTASYARKKFAGLRAELSDFLRTVDPADLRRIEDYINLRNTEFPKLADEMKPILRAIERLLGQRGVSDEVVKRLETIDFFSSSAPQILEQLAHAPPVTKNPPGAECLLALRDFLRGWVEGKLDLDPLQKAMTLLRPTSAQKKLARVSVGWLLASGIASRLSGLGTQLEALDKHSAFVLLSEQLPFLPEEFKFLYLQADSLGKEHPLLEPNLSKAKLTLKRAITLSPSDLDLIELDRSPAPSTLLLLLNPQLCTQMLSMGLRNRLANELSLLARPSKLGQFLLSKSPASILSTLLSEKVIDQSKGELLCKLLSFSKLPSLSSFTFSTNFYQKIPLYRNLLHEKLKKGISLPSTLIQINTLLDLLVPTPSSI